LKCLFLDLTFGMEKPHLDQRILSQFDDDDAAAAE